MFFNLLVIIPAVLALPRVPRESTSLATLQSASFQNLAQSFPSDCSPSLLIVPLPSNQTQLTIPPGETVSAVTVGRGIQNYTCDESTGKYVSSGAVANLFDASCIFTATSAFAPTDIISSLLPKIAFSSLAFPDSSGLPVAVHHFFVDTPGTTGSISPEFDSTSDKVIASKSGSVNAPNANDVAWLQLSALQGTLAKTVYRINTVSGQPPASCAAGEVHSTQYAAMYWFTN